MMASFCCTPEKWYLSPKFAREARLWPFSYELLPNLVLKKMVDIFKNSLERRLRIDALEYSWIHFLPLLNTPPSLVESDLSLPRRSILGKSLIMETICSLSLNYWSLDLVEISSLLFLFQSWIFTWLISKAIFVK